MNRRSFLFGGGIASVVSATVALAVKESRPEGHVALCKGSHEPRQEYLDLPALAIGHPKDLESSGRGRSLVPCKHCNVMFAMTTRA